MKVDTAFAKKSAVEGAHSVWKIIWWNILAFAARIVAGLWLVAAISGGAIVYQYDPVAGWLIGLVIFVGLPWAYGAFKVSGRDLPGTINS